MNPNGVSRLRVLAARSRQTLGWAGLLGAGLLLLALVWFALAWRAHRLPVPEVSAPVLSAKAVEPTPETALALELPRRSEVPLLLTQIQQTVVSQGLAWAAAEYKLLPATDAAPASLEVRCTLKGSYPKLRAAIAQLLRGVTGLTLRDLAMSRPNGDTPEVEAKLALVVFLQDEAAAAGVADVAVARGKP